jgi:mannose-6-phosphate isomerase-like protein (cupin superfamily)
MKFVALAMVAAGLAMAADSKVDLYSPQELEKITQQLSKKQTQFAAQPLERYGNHYTMVAYREATGSSEVHEKEADVLYAISGNATIITGGKLVNSKPDKPGELRGTSISGGTKQAFAQGAVIHIPAGVAHQLIIEKGQPFTYFVVKVIEQ